MSVAEAKDYRWVIRGGCAFCVIALVFGFWLMAERLKKRFPFKMMDGVEVTSVNQGYLPEEITVHLNGQNLTKDQVLNGVLAANPGAGEVKRDKNKIWRQDPDGRYLEIESHTDNYYVFKIRKRKPPKPATGP